MNLHKPVFRQQQKNASRIFSNLFSPEHLKNLIYFLESANDLGKFIPNPSELSHPLYLLNVVKNKRFYTHEVTSTLVSEESALATGKTLSNHAPEKRIK